MARQGVAPAIMRIRLDIAAKYRLEVTMQSAGSSTPLKEPPTAIFDKPLAVS
jgi:hypothetical protein